MPIPLPPTILLAVGGLLLIFGHWRPTAPWGGLVWIAAWCGTAYALTTSGSMPMDSAARIAHRFVWSPDQLAVAGQALALTFGLLFGIGSLGKRADDEGSAERFGFLSFFVAGAMLVAAANDAISLALSLEIVQFASLALRRQDRQREISSTLGDSEAGRASPGDAALWLAIVASGCIWLGIALLTSLTASTQFDEIRLVLTQAYSPGPGRIAIGAGSKLGLLSIGLIVMGLSGRIGLVPWHIAFLEQCRGMSYWTSGCVLVGGQLVGVLALVRLCGTVWIGFGNELIVLLIVLSGLTFVIAGAMAAQGLATGEGSLRRWATSFAMLHGAWLLVGLIAVSADLASPENSLAAAGGQPGALSLLMFSAGASLFGLAGLFHLLSHLSRDGREVEFVDELLGLGPLAPLTATALMIIVASLIGQPPLWGFWGKWLLLVASLNVRAGGSSVAPHAGILLLLLVGMFSTLLFAGVAIRLARALFLEAPISRALPQGSRASLLGGTFIALCLIGVGLFPARLLTALNALQRPQNAIVPDEPAGKRSGADVQAGIAK